MGADSASRVGTIHPTMTATAINPTMRRMAIRQVIGTDASRRQVFFSAIRAPPFIMRGILMAGWVYFNAPTSLKYFCTPGCRGSGLFTALAGVSWAAMGWILTKAYWPSFTLLKIALTTL